MLIYHVDILQNKMYDRNINLKEILLVYDPIISYMCVLEHENIDRQHEQASGIFIDIFAIFLC